MLDIKQLVIEGGTGGNGHVSFRREKYAPRGGPDGGNGGNGGSVILAASRQYNTLYHLRRLRRVSAQPGLAGQGKNKTGRSGADVRLEVPLGTVVWGIREDGQRSLLADLEEDGQEAIIARGGGGGWGNAHFVSSVNREPLLAEAGVAGEVRTILLELKLLADVGVVGLPNAGKSTFVAAVSKAKPEIGAYPFTTLEPVLGVVETHQERFIIVEIPGLIERAHEGRGLGLEFLRHAERTRVLLHLVDGAAEDPFVAFQQVNNELACYSSTMAEKPQVVAITKLDLPEVRDRVPRFEEELRRRGIRAWPLSAAIGEGVDQVLGQLVEVLSRQAKVLEPLTPRSSLPAGPVQVVATLKVEQENGVFVVSCPRAERIVVMTDLRNWRARVQLHQELERLGVFQLLRQRGIKAGDVVRIGSVEMEWQ